MIETKSITKEETDLYFKYLKEGKVEYREKIIIGNYRLVIHLALKYTNTEYELEDIVSVGLIGLIKAVDSFDSNKKINFSTYAGRCINNEILMLLRHKKKWVSLEDTYHQTKKGDNVLIENILTDNKNIEKDVIDKLTLKKYLNIMSQLLNNMEPMKKQLLFDYFGINCPPLKQEEIAKKYGISRSTVTKTINKTLKDLKLLINLEEERESLQKLLTKNKKNNKINV